MSEEAIAAEVEGIDPGPVELWFTDHVPGVRLPLAFERIAGGRSNLTYGVADAAGNRWALRRPPLGKRLASAHDMGREHRILAAMQGTSVPVPPVVGLCEDESVNGAPFYVMEWVEGPVLRSEREVADSFAEPERRAIGDRVVDTLVDIHAVDPEEVGLGELGKKEDYLARQLHRWHGQWEKSKIDDVPLVDEVHDRLTARIPEQGPATIVHGDYRLDNMILEAETGEVAAVVDWELCTLGDPLADVGLLMVYWSQPGDVVIPLYDPPTTAPGFPTRDELRDRYGERSGRDLSELDYYVAFGYWKLAVILQGIVARVSGGGYGDDPDAQKGLEEFAKVVARLAEQADEAERRLGG